MDILGKKKFLVSCVVFIYLLTSGCKFLELRYDEDGRPHTKLTDILSKSGEIAGDIGSCVPGYGVVGGGVLLILSGVANGILSVAVRRRGRKARDE